ncbi:CHAT domain-containing protein [Cladophialophora immunda]|nr:CHAT domain-containing protein [Cladophialophora immunda]
MDDPGRAPYARAMQLLQRYLTDWNTDDLNHAIEFGQLAVRTTPENHVDRAARFSDLGTMFAQRYQQEEQLEDLNQAIGLASDSVSSAPIGYPYLPAFSNNLSGYFGMRYDHTGEVDDLTQAITIAQQAVDSASNDDENLLKYLDSLATNLERRSTLERSESSREDAQRSVELGKLVLQLLPDDDDNLPIYMNNLGNRFQSLYDQENKVEYLDEAIKWARLAIPAIDESDPIWLPSRNNLAIALERRYDLTGSREDLDEAIEIAQEVVNSTEGNDPKLAPYLNTLAVKIAALYHRAGNVPDLEEAVKLTRRALEVAPADHRDRADWWNNIGTLLESLFRRTGKLQYIEEAVEAAQQAVELTRKDHPDRAAYLINLSNNLETRFEATGDIHDLNSSLEFAEKAVSATAEGDSRLSAYLKSLGTKFSHRYETAGDMNDLEEAVRFARDALLLVPEGHRTYPTYLSSLATALHSQFERTRDIKHLNDAIKLSQRAVHLTERSHQDYAAWKVNLANHLSARYDYYGDIADLKEVINLARDTVELTKGEHLDREPCRNNLAAALSKRYKRNKNIEDLDGSISLTQQALDSTSEDNPNWSAYVSNLGIRLLSRYNRSGDIGDRDSALQHFLRLSDTTQATPLDRLKAMRAAIRLLQAKESWSQANKLAAEALKLLPLVCGRYLGLQDQQYVLAQTSGLAADACSLALKNGDVEEAILRLELGRGIMVGYMIESRSDLSELKKECPELANHYENLQRKASQKIDSRDSPVRQMLLKERREAIQEIESCVQQIHKETSHKRFLLGPAIEELKEASNPGPLVLVNVTDISADALIVSPQEIKAIRLPGFFDRAAPSTVKGEIESYERLSRGDDDRDIESETPSHLESDHLSWLWTNCVKLILQELGGYKIPVHNNLPRVWWVGTGIASSLPFHAAGEAFGLSTENTLSHIVPSYTQSIKALLYSRSQILRSGRHSKSKCSMMIVAMPQTPGQRPLPGVDGEAKAIANVSKDVYNVEVLPQPAAEGVLQKLSTTDIVHFACHAISDPFDPSKSHLLLQKPGAKGFVIDRLTLSQIAGVVTEGQAQLAFLSACSTAEVKASKLTDEGLHLANAFQVVGFGHVIGALWSANDEVSARLSELFYANLIEAGQTTSLGGLVASALRNAVVQVRSEFSENPELWAPFIHLGA